MKHRRLVVMTASLLVLLAVHAPAHGIVVAESKPALAGIGMPLPPISEAARQALTARADAGNLDAIYTLAHLALFDSNDPMGGLYFMPVWGKPEEAERWWRKAAALGDPKAMILLGHMYAEPWGVPQDLSKAAGWFEKAADRNNLEAINALVELYMGEWSDARDDVKANQWLMRAASMGGRHAMLLLGLRYDAGWGIREDPAQAAQWYEKVIASKQAWDYSNDRDAAWNNLGALYEQGRGVPKDETRAAELYGKVAHYGGVAAYNLAVLCEAGRGVPQDKTAAVWLYRNAAFTEIPEARAALKRLEFRMPATAQAFEDEAGALLAHGNEKRSGTPCDP